MTTPLEAKSNNMTGTALENSGKIELN